MEIAIQSARDAMSTHFTYILPRECYQITCYGCPAIIRSRSAGLRAASFASLKVLLFYIIHFLQQ